MSMDYSKETCPICNKPDIEYVEFECNEPFTAPAELRFKALHVWAVVSAEKQIICQNKEYVHFRFLSDGSERLVKMLGFDREKYYKKLDDLNNTSKPCEQDGCKNDGFACFSVFEPDEPLGWWCEDHMRENGVCPGCHIFKEGFEDFDFSDSGYCGSCEEELFEDDYEEWDDDYYEEYDYYP